MCVILEMQNHNTLRSFFDRLSLPASDSQLDAGGGVLVGLSTLLHGRR